MKAFLLALEFSLIYSSSQLDPAEITGDWYSIFMAADNVEKIEIDGVHRLYFRHLECVDGCNELVVTAYSKLTGECQKLSVVATKGPDDVYEAQFDGQNFLKIEYHSHGDLGIYHINVDEEGKVMHKTMLAAKKDRVSEDQKKKFEDLTAEKEIPKENIRHVIETDDCPAA